MTAGYTIIGGGLLDSVLNTEGTMIQVVTKTGSAVVVNGGAAQTSDVKVTLDGEAITFPTASMEDTVFLKTVDYNVIIAQGKVAGHTVGHLIGHGEGSVISTTTYVILANATVTQPSANTAMQLVSTSANDASAGTGAQQVTIKYLPIAWGAGKSETITLNGVTPVALSNTDVYRISELYVNRVGSGGTTDGTITLVDVATGLVKYAQIDPGVAFFERAIHYVPDNTLCVITGALLGCTTVGGVDFRIFTTQEDAAGNIIPRAEFTVVEAQGSQSITLDMPLVTSNPNNKRIAIGLAVRAQAVNQHAAGTLRFYEEPI